MTDEPADAELAYHLGELRADLGLVRDDLGRAGQGASPRSLIGAEALLEHDLEVHVPKALALLGSAVPRAEAERADQGEPGAAEAAMAARGHVAAALAALENEALPATDRVLAAADAIENARRILAEAIHTLDA